MTTETNTLALERALPNPAHRPTDLETGPGVVLLHFPGDDPERDPVVIESAKFSRPGHCRISIMNQAALLLPRLTCATWLAVIRPLLEDARAAGQKFDLHAEALLRADAAPFVTR